MSLAPKPENILDLIAILDQGFRYRQPLDSVLKQALPVLADVLAGREVCIYDPNLRLLAASGTGPLPVSHNNAQQALIVTQPVFDTSSATWLVPLVMGGQALGLLQVSGEASDEPAWWQVVAAQLAQAIERNEAQTNILQINELGQSMMAATSPLDLLQSLRKLSVNAERIAHESIIYDEDGVITDIVVRAVLTRDREETFSASLADVESEAMLAANIAFCQQMPDYNIFVADTAAPPVDFPQEIARAAHHTGIGSYVFIPILRDGRLQDLVRVSFPVAQKFSDRVFELYDVSRNQLSLMFQSLALIQEVQDNAERLEQQVRVLQLLNQISTVISITKDEQQLLNQSAQVLVEALGIDYCQVFMLDVSGEQGTVVCDYPHRGSVGDPFQLADLPFKDTPSADHPLPLVVNDVRGDPDFGAQKRSQLLSNDVSAFMLMPLFVRGQLVGAIQMDIQDMQQTFTPEMTDIARTILAQVIVGLQNIRLLADAQERSEQLQRVAERAALLNEIGARLQTTSNVENALHEAARGIQQVLGAGRVSIRLGLPDNRGSGSRKDGAV